MFKQKYCPECGEVPIPHTAELLSQTIDYYLRSIPLTHFLFSIVEPRVRLLGRYIPLAPFVYSLRVAHTLGLCSLYKSTQPFHDTRMKALYEGAEARGVLLSQYAVGKSHVCFHAEKVVGGIKKQVLFQIIPRPRYHRSPSLSWMDDKGILKEKMRKAGFPHAEGGVARTIEEAIAIFNTINAPVIVKPHIGSRGRHTTLDVRDVNELKRAFAIAREISTHAVIERYLHGTVHRVTLVGGIPVAVARREYPHVIGDGIHTVRELVDIENSKPLRHNSHFRPLDKEYRVKEALEKQNYTLTSIPKEGAKIILSDKNSRFHGTITEDVTDTVHRDNIELFTKFGVFLGDPIVGVDFMIEDMARSYKEQPDAGVIECNAMPFIDVHHVVASGRPINVAAYLWDEVFK